MKSLFNNIYNSRRVFITGHTGFKGSWLSTWLHLLGAKVIGYALKPPTDPNMYEILDLNGKLDSITGDIRDFEKLKQVLSDFKPEIIFHLAAQPIVRLSYADPRETFETNIIGTVNVIEAARKVHSVKAIVNVTSDKCYENKEWVYGYRENDPMGGHDPYSSSKGCAELVTSAYRNSFFYNKESAKEHYISLSSARAGNVIGGGDWSVDRLIRTAYAL
jgi:CDP-glucose 4,6-dehydratase